MKRILGIVLLLALVFSCGALAEEAEENSVRIEFGTDFSMEIPEGWLYYAPDDQMTESGVIYCISDPEGKNWLYVQEWADICADTDALQALIEETTDASVSGKHTFGDTEFIVYEPTSGNVSCCATLLGVRVFNFIFTPQDDADYMLTAARMLDTFDII